ncbi:MAG: Tn3 family transposase [Candidatus Rokubacteria bacterium]|nr:Tn3 family transposase [Candidatus Rokubacteria bacterium]
MSIEELEPSAQFLPERVRRNPVELPDDPSAEQLFREYTLSSKDLEEIRRCRGSANQLGFALQLCVVRHYGRFLVDYSDIPLGILNHLGRQLGLDNMLFGNYGAREATESEHRQRIATYLGLKRFDLDAEQRLEEWIARQQLLGAVAREIYGKAEECLKGWKFVLPAPLTLEAVVSRLVARARTEVRERIGTSIHERLGQAIDHMLEVPEGQRYSLLNRLKEDPPAPHAEAIRHHMELVQELMREGVELLDLSSVDAETVHRLADLVREESAHDIRRLPSATRYARMGCFLVETLKTHIDDAVNLNAHYMTDLWRKATNEAKDLNAEFNRKSVHRGMELLADLGDMGLEALALGRHEISLEPLIAEHDRTRLEEDLRGGVETCRSLLRLRIHAFLNRLRVRYPNLRVYTPIFLEVLDFKGNPGTAALLEALELLRQANREGWDEIPFDAPDSFIPRKVRPHLRAEGKLDRQLYEIFFFRALQKALRSGDVYIPASNDYVSFWNLLLPEDRWQQERERFCETHNISIHGNDELSRLANDFSELAWQASRDRNVQLRKDHLFVPRLEKEAESSSVVKLRKLLHADLTVKRIEEVVMESDSLCHWTRHFCSRSGQPLSPDHLIPLYACIVALGTNLGLAVMCNSTAGLTPDLLRYVANRYIRPETLKLVIAELVDFLDSLPISKVWGKGTISSSDGQRFVVHGGTLLGTVYPRYFGYYDRAVSVYTHVSDQFTVFSSRVIACSAREAIHVVDGFLENDSVLRPTEHTTDTHGYVELLFPILWLMGIDFIPRIADIAGQRLYKLDKDAHYGRLDPVLRHPVNLDRIRDQWDSILRLVASLQMKVKPAHVLLSKLVDSKPSDSLGQALLDLGRIRRTMTTLRLAMSPDLRRRQGRQLNVGEERHNLAKRNFFADQGEFQKPDYEEIMNKASCLALLCNGCAVTTAIQYAGSIERLRDRGYPVRDEDLAHISPLAREHIIPSGTYHFTK